MAVEQINPQQAYDFLKENQEAIMIDVRSSMEYLFVGHPKGATHIAWIDEPTWEINENFYQETASHIMHKSDLDPHLVPVILICRSGKRSLEAGNVLVNGGFSEVYNIDEGFEGELDENHHRSTVGGWRFRGLPWEQC